MLLLKTTTTAQVRLAFTEIFPLLDIKFYRIAHDHFKGSKQKDEISKEVELGKLSPEMPEEELPFNDDMSVDDFETLLEEKFGLHVQVFRKSGSQWMQTSATDHWKLSKQLRVAQETEAFLSETRR